MDSSDGMGCLSVTQIVLVILKLTELIGWSWWLVFMPLWIGIILFLIVMLIGGIVLAVGRDEDIKERRKEMDRIWNGKHGEDD